MLKEFHNPTLNSYFVILRLNINERTKNKTILFTDAVDNKLSNAFENLASEIIRDGTLSSKEKSLIVRACAVAIKCEYCIKAHKKNALESGANMDEIFEAAAVAGQVHLGSGFTSPSLIQDD